MALRLIAEREAEVEAFQPQAWWSVNAILTADSGSSFPVSVAAAAPAAAPAAAAAAAAAAADPEHGIVLDCSMQVAPAPYTPYTKQNTLQLM